MNTASVLARLRSPSARHRWSVASRTLAGVIGGYAVTSLFNLALPLLLGAVGASVPQVLLGTMMASFFLYAGIVMAVFHARSARRAWVWLIVAAVPLGLLVSLLLPEVRS